MAEFFVKVRVDPTQARAGARKVKKELGGIDKQAKQLQGQLLRTFGAVAIIAGIGAGVRVLADFSQEMSTVQAITKATEEQFISLRETAKALGAATRFSATDAAKGMKFLARAGFEVNEVIESVDDTLRLAQAGALGLGEAANITANVLRGFRLDVDQAGRVVDVLALAANSANTDVRQLGDAMRFVAPVAAGVGISIEETAAAITQLSDAGLQASMAGTGLRRVLSTLEAPAAAEEKILAQLGLTSDQVRVSQVGLTEALKALAAAGIDTGAALTLFGDRGGPAFEVMVNAIPGIEKMNLNLQNAEGTAKDIADTMDKNLNGALFAVKSAVEAVTIALGDLGAESGLTKFFFNLADALRFLARNMDTLASATKALGIVLAIVFAPQILNQAVLLIAKLAEGLIALSTSMGALSASAATASISMGKISGASVALRIALVKLGAAFKALWAVILANPLIALGALLIGTVLFALDQLNKKMDEAEAAQDRAHQNALRMIRARLRQVQSDVAATKSLQSFIDGLERENKLSALTVETREEEVAITKALTLAKRPLSDIERQTILDLLEKKRVIAANNEVLRQEEALLESIKGPQVAYQNNVKLLDSLVEKGSITQEEYTATLLEWDIALNKVNATFDDVIAQLKEENRLLQLNESDREISQALLAAELVLGKDLTDQQEEQIKNLILQRQEIERLNDARGDRGALDIPVAPLAEVDIIPPGFDSGLQRIKEEVMDTGALIEHTLVGAFQSAQDALIEFIVTGETSFKRLVDSILADLTRLLMNQLLSSIISGLTSTTIPLGSSGLPGFQQGTSFTVGGSGGPDSQVVAFRGTPGEQVDVSRPGQNPNVNVAPPQVNLRIVNVDDPSTALTALGSAEGEKIVMNAIRRNINTIRKL